MSWRKRTGGISFFIRTRFIIAYGSCPWRLVADDLGKLDFLLVTNLANIKLSLNPDGYPRQSQQEAVIRIEKELPVIKAHRIATAKAVMEKVYEMPWRAPSTPSGKPKRWRQRSDFFVLIII